MKNIFLSAFMLVSYFCVSQNTYDPYKTCAPNYYPAVDQFGSFIEGYATPGYIGEYQIFLKPSTGITSKSAMGNYWTQSAFQNNLITYKIELVSFPFFLNCTNCVGPHISPPISTTERKLYMPNTSFPYDPSENAWVRNTTGFPAPASGNTYQYKLLREFTGNYGEPTNGYTHYATLATKGFVNGNPSEQVLENQKSSKRSTEFLQELKKKTKWNITSFRKSYQK